MRYLNRLLAILVALALGVVGVLVAVESVAALVDEGPLWLPLEDWDSWLRERQWSDDVVTIIAVTMGVVGLLLIIAELWPRRPRSYPVRIGDGEGRGERSVALDRKGLEEHIRELVRRTRGVRGSSVRAARRKLDVRAVVPQSADPRAVRANVRSRVGEELDALALQKKMRIKVQVEEARERVR